MKTEWYEIYANDKDGKRIALAKVKSKGLAYIIAQKLKEIYQGVEMKRGRNNSCKQ